MGRGNRYGHPAPEVLARLRARGFLIAVDDLGAGYAGLNTFALLKPDIVKFDMQLLRRIHEDPTRAKLVQSIASLCREIDTRTIAEGIECEEERDCVLSLRCDYIQGFYYARPEREFVSLSL